MLGHNWTSDTTWMLSELVDWTRLHAVDFRNVYRDKGAPATEVPKPWPRPGVEDRAAAEEARDRQAHIRLSNLLLPGR